MTNSMLRLLALSLLAAVLVACGGGGGDGNGSNVTTGPSALSYPNPVQATVGTAIAALTPTVTGSVTSYAVTPALPPGLVLDTSSGRISGIPTAVAGQTTYVVTATGAGGSTTFSIAITIKPAPPTNLRYPSPQRLDTTTPVSLTPTVTGAIDAFSISPALPPGLTLNPATGEIAGTPTEASADATYTVIAANVSGSTSTSILISVRLVPPTAPALTLGVGLKQLRFDWTPSLGANQYWVRWRDLNGDHSLGPSLPGTRTMSVADISVLHEAENARTFGYVVRAYNAAGTADSPIAVLSKEQLLSTIGYFKAAKPKIEDGFGWSIALSDDGRTLAVGAPYQPWYGNVGDPGGVYVFQRDDSGAWAQQAHLSGRNAGDHFGWDVSLSADGSLLAVSAPDEDVDDVGPHADAGAVYLYRVTRGTAGGVRGLRWLTAAAVFHRDRFGAAIALSTDGGTLAVATGTSFFDRADRVDVFALADGTSQGFVTAPLGSVQGSNTEPNDGFGASLALSATGEVLVVGAPGEGSGSRTIDSGQSDNSAIAAGAVYVFGRFARDMWAQRAYLKAPNSNAFDWFGSSVAVDRAGEHVVVGAPGEDGSQTSRSLLPSPDTSDGATDAGAAYTFYRQSSGLWHYGSYLKASNAHSQAQFGARVGLSSTKLWVSAPYEYGAAVGVVGCCDDVALADLRSVGSGAMYVFTLATPTIVVGQPPQTMDLGVIAAPVYVKAPNTGYSDAFGSDFAVTFDAQTLAVGAPFEEGGVGGINGNSADNTVRYSGAAYLY